MKFARKVRYVRAIVVWGVLAALAPSVVEAADKPTKQQLIERGRELFTKETFDGNGRTCATCHPATNNFTIDPASSRSCPRARSSERSGGQKGERLRRMWRHGCLCCGLGGSLDGEDGR